MNEQTKKFLIIFLVAIAILMVVSFALRLVFAIAPLVIFGAIGYWIMKYFDEKRRRR